MADNIPTSSQPPLGKVREVVESIAKRATKCSEYSSAANCRARSKASSTRPKRSKNDLLNFRFAAIDSMTTCMEMGWPAIAAAKAAKTGASLDDCIFRRRTQACIPRDSCSLPNRCCSCRRAAASEKPPRSSANDQPHARAHCKRWRSEHLLEVPHAEKSPCKNAQVLGEDTAPSGLKNRRPLHWQQSAGYAMGRRESGTAYRVHAPRCAGEPRHWRARRPSHGHSV